MDTTNKYQKIIEKIIENYAQLRYAHGEVEKQTVFDREQNQYLLMIVGKDGNKMVHGCLIHIEIVKNKIWIHRDGTEDGVAGDILTAGIPKENIVLGFYSPEQRKITDFAIC
ncbi:MULTISPECIES: XisI protein [Spirulina sp. CCY15215]|uniref:XisI protein n=1 Tax=Spirulina sp. CCY15215 TaxID=2767591 RepID=UPI0019515966|nr:XisI protein [Spirulina major]